MTANMEKISEMTTHRKVSKLY